MFTRVLRCFLFVLVTSSVVLIIFLSLHHISLSLHSLSRESNPTFRDRLSNLESSSSGSSAIPHEKASQYVWCVNHYGPNNQLKDFIKCCIIASLNNYTLIVPPLYPHYDEKDRSMQWFDHFYDLKQLSLLINLTTLDQFIPPRKINANKMMIDCYVQQTELVAGRSWYPKNTLNSVQSYYKTKIIFNRTIHLSRHFTMTDLYRTTKNCSSIFLHIHYTTFRHFFESPNIQLQKVFEHLRRLPLIQRMSTQLIKQLPELVIGKRQSNQSLSSLAVTHFRLGDHTVMSLSVYIKQLLRLINSGVRFTHLHIMCPYLNSTDIAQLTESLPVMFTTSQHILQNAHFTLDSYLFAILEQEIAYQAGVFIGSPWTTFSATVVVQKVYQQRGIVYLFSNGGDKLPFLVTKQNVKYFK